MLELASSTWTCSLARRAAWSGKGVVQVGGVAGSELLVVAVARRQIGVVGRWEAKRGGIIEFAQEVTLRPVSGDATQLACEGRNVMSFHGMLPFKLGRYLSTGSSRLRLPAAACFRIARVVKVLVIEAMR